MKLFTEKYISPYPEQGEFKNVFIEDTAYRINRNENLFVVSFQMYYLNDGKRIVLDENQLSFRGTNQEFEQGLTTSKRAAIIKVRNSGFDAEIPQFIELPNPDYSPEIEGSVSTKWEWNPDFVPQFTEIPLLEYLYANNGEMPLDYEVVDFGFPNYETALQFFEGGSLDSPELSIVNPFARKWLKNNLQIKGQNIIDFEFID